jgi:hypothetical protein
MRIISLSICAVVIFYSLDRPFELQAQSRNTGSSSGSSSGSGRTTGSNANSNSGQGLAQPTISTSLGSQSNFFSDSGFIGNQNQNRFIGATDISSTNANQPTNRGSELRSLKSTAASTTLQPTPTENLLYQPRMQVSFAFKPNPLLQITSGMTQKVRNHDQFKNVQIEVDPSGELILTGIVKSAEERKLAEAYLRLEPGVTNIVNSIVVEQ